METKTISCKKCGRSVDEMQLIGDTYRDESIQLKHNKYITLCGSCRWRIFPKHVPRIQYQNFITDYCKKYYPL